jgi:hypothetical protein
MAKKKSVTKSAVQSNSFLASFDLEKILPQKYHLLAVFLVIVILFLIFLNPMYFGGKTFQSGDILTSKSLIPMWKKTVMASVSGILISFLVFRLMLWVQLSLGSILSLWFLLKFVTFSPLFSP